MNFVTGYAFNRCKSRIPNVQWICREKDLSFLLRIKEKEIEITLSDRSALQ